MPSVACAPEGADPHFMLCTSISIVSRLGEGESSDATIQSTKQRSVLRRTQILRQPWLWAAAWHAHCASRSQRAGCAHHFGALPLSGPNVRAMLRNQKDSSVKHLWSSIPRQISSAAWAVARDDDRSRYPDDDPHEMTCN